MYSSDQISMMLSMDLSSPPKATNTSRVLTTKGTSKKEKRGKPTPPTSSRKKPECHWVAKEKKSTTQFFDISHEDDDDLETVAESTSDSDAALAATSEQQEASTSNDDVDDTCTGSGSSGGDDDGTSEEESASGDDSTRNTNSAPTAEAQKLKALALWSECKNEMTKEDSQSGFQCQQVIASNRTPLSSVVSQKQKTLLKNNAAAFVPSWGKPAQQNRQLSDGERMLQRIVGDAFVAHSWELHVPSEVLSELTDVNVVLKVPQQMPLQMMQTSLKLLEAALLNEGETVEIQDIDFNSMHLSLQYTTTPLTQCCWEFTNWGQCPRVGCHWPHVTPENISVSICMDCKHQDSLKAGGKVVFKCSQTSPTSQMLNNAVFCQPELQFQSAMTHSEGMTHAEWMCSAQQQEHVYDGSMDVMCTYESYEMQQVGQQQAVPTAQHQAEKQTREQCKQKLRQQLQQQMQQQGKQQPEKQQQEKPQQVQSAPLGNLKENEVEEKAKVEAQLDVSNAFLNEINMKNAQLEARVKETAVVDETLTKPKPPATPPGVFNAPARPPGIFFAKEESQKTPRLPTKSASEPSKLGHSSESDDFFTERQRNFLERLRAKLDGPDGEQQPEKVKAPTTPKIQVDMSRLDIPKAWSQTSWAKLSEGDDDFALP